MLVIFDSRGPTEVRFVPEGAPGKLEVFTTSLFECPKLTRGGEELPFSIRGVSALADRQGKLYCVTGETFAFREPGPASLYVDWNFHVGPMSIRTVKVRKTAHGPEEQYGYKEGDVLLALRYYVPERAWAIRLDFNLQMELPLVDYNPSTGVGTPRYERKEIL